MEEWLIVYHGQFCYTGPISPCKNVAVKGERRQNIEGGSVSCFCMEMKMGTCRWVKEGSGRLVADYQGTLRNAGHG